jgi:hypothetical protein
MIIIFGTLVAALIAFAALLAADSPSKPRALAE